MSRFERIVRARAYATSWLFFLGTLGVAPEAAACPNCTVGEHVGRPFWHDGVQFAFAVSLSAFIVVLGLCLRSHVDRGPGRPERRSRPRLHRAI
jgi:hypothetical protein